MNSGWGNGYVAVPPGHKCYALQYDVVSDMIEYNVHGGLTFGRRFRKCHPSIQQGFLDYIPIPDPIENLNITKYWVFGFDTCHAFDTIHAWPKEAVINETFNLFGELKKM